MDATLRLSALLVLAVFGLGGCKNDTKAYVAPQDQFGPVFSKAFRADPDSVPINPGPGDAGTLSLTTEPVDF